ncbi:hypothetical protein [Legionella worsleiensis]|uniref:Uncharacterized protein n=1 Tax=Legionella worsleiensis TaxID=45076 RepID=A0A0W1AJM3_9GAMM|nr:hypothetical protein [Legionella worsleiensis]KTD81492.1 hypothetical protein Lwor_0530 [Legionella worsleiensis]STY32051.1 Uncharacterised protein [Legionella worsleiensis]
MPNVLSASDFNALVDSLPHVFRNQCINEGAVLAQAFPLLNLICPHREELNRLSIGLNAPETPVSKDLVRRLAPIIMELEGNFDYDALFPCRLPIVLSEFPKHSRIINQAIQRFNHIIEAYHKGEINTLATTPLELHYKNILTAIKEQVFYKDSDSFWQLNCDNESLWQLISMMAGWSKISPIVILNMQQSNAAAASSEHTETASTIEFQNIPVAITDAPQEIKPVSKNPFTLDYSYNFNRAGRLDTETNFLLLNAFGMKFGGHFDAQVKYPPRFIPLDQLHAIIRRQLSHRMDVWPTESFQLWLETSLVQLGVEFIPKNKKDSSKDLLVNPFLKEPISFLSPEKIRTVLIKALCNFTDEEFQPSHSELDILSQYLFELLQGFQANPGLALGIGANWDGTVNLSNEAGAYAFKFKESRADWGRRFKQLSLHRQGPSEARMNAAIGVQFELQSLLTDFDYMSQLQPSEYREVIYNALVDNLVTELLPEPAYFENDRYPKYKKQHIIKRNENGLSEIISFLVASKQGTFFKGRDGVEKQTPMYRRAGTLDVQAFPKNTTCSEQSKASYAGNPLGPLHLQFTQAMYRNVRGHIVYDPIAPDQFLEDAFYGQVIRGENEDYLPFMGVVPKNFDRFFKQPKELCASFVIRMLHSSRIMEYCPTFKTTYERIKTRFLPDPQKSPPALPESCNGYLAEKYQQLVNALTNPDRHFTECQKIFYSVFKNLIYSLYDLGRDDQQFKQGFLTFIHSLHAFYPASKAQCDKLIRDLTVTKPVDVSPEAITQFDLRLNFLRDLTAYFYPQPTETLAQEIAAQAKLHVKPLLKTQAITAYFNLQKQSQQENLSRKQTPGMLYAALKHGGPSRTVVHDYEQMHNYNFPSYYRDPDGTPQGEPQLHDSLIDWGAKHLGAGLQILHKYHLFALIHNPIYQTFTRAKQHAAAHQEDRLKPLWVFKGVLEGLFWHGIIIGLWQTVTTPLQMLGDFFNWQLAYLHKSHSRVMEHPLILPAAPANELNTKTQAAADSRDHLLRLLRKRNSLDSKKKSVFAYTIKLIQVLYPQLNADDLTLCNHQLRSDFPITAKEWSTLFAPILKPAKDPDLSALLHRHNEAINNSLIQAVYQSITHPDFTREQQSLRKRMQSAFSLNAKQNEVLKQLIASFKNLSPEKKRDYIELFQFNGLLYKALQKRDRLIQKVQNYMLQVFDEQWIRTLLFNHYIDRFITELTPQTLEHTLSMMPDNLKWPLHQLLISNNTHDLEDYALNENQTTLLIKILAIVRLIEQPEHKETLLNQCTWHEGSHEGNISIKEKAHNKWAQFAKRELNHQLLSCSEVEHIINCLKDHLSSYDDLIPLINRLEHNYRSLDTNESLDLFYETSCTLKHRVHEYLLMQPKIQVEKAKTLLKNFLNITMNAVINARLDQMEVLDIGITQNPLLTSQAIEAWLTALQRNNRHLRSLLEQQLHQAPSLDHTLWRCKCIFQVLEQGHPEQRVKNTGMQTLLRYWSQHKDNVTLSGDHYINPEPSKSNKSTYANLFNDSITMHHAMTRVRDKLPRLSIFNAPRKMEPASASDSAQHTPT